MGFAPESRGRRVAGVLLPVLLVLAAIGTLSWLRSRDAKVPQTAQVVVLNGEAVVTRADAGSDPPLTAGAMTTVQRGDVLVTGPESAIALTFGASGSLELGPDSRLEVLELTKSPSSREWGVSLALDSGRLLARVERVLMQKLVFQLETRVATLTSSEGELECEVIDASRIRVVVRSGQVRVSMGEQVAQLEAGQQLVATLGQPLQPSGVMPLPSLSVVPTAWPVIVPSPTPTYTNWQKTLFPPAITPTRPGDKVVRYTVQPGDTLYSIAQAYGVSWQDLWEANRHILSSPELLRAGQELIIPRQ